MASYQQEAGARTKQVQILLAGLHYQDKPAVEVQLMQLFARFHSLPPFIDKYEFNDTTQQDLLKLEGTIPIKVKSMMISNTYHIPVAIWLPLNFPNVCPICYVMPTQGMTIKKKHKNVDSRGFVYHPYLHSWHPQQSQLVEMVNELCLAFGKSPPLYASRSRSSSKASPHPHPEQNSNSKQVLQPQTVSPTPEQYGMTDASNVLTQKVQADHNGSFPFPVGPAHGFNPFYSPKAAQPTSPALQQDLNLSTIPSAPSPHLQQQQHYQMQPLQPLNVAVASVQIEEDEKVEESYMNEQYGALGHIMGMIKSHKDLMSQMEAAVDAYIAKSGSSDILKAAKNKALEDETRLMNALLDDIGALNEFLNNIILIENLFNAQYDATQRQQQRAARQQHARIIAQYEKRKKPISEVASFIDLMFAGVSVYLPAFKKWLQDVERKCEEKAIHIVSSSGAKAKNIERAFYKSFYVYAAENDGFQQMTDVLRCSLVFDNFDHLYRCFSVVELAAGDGGVLRVKDRFHPETMPFGYRDLLINIYAPGSKVVCEVQLHHVMFYKYKKISHRMYKKARLFEEGDSNLAYMFADKKVRKKVGDQVYEPTADELGIDKDEENQETKENDKEHEKHDYELTLCELFEKHQPGLVKFVDKFVDEGYTDAGQPVWQSIDDLPLYDDIEQVDIANEESCQDLIDMGMKKGHRSKYKKTLIALKKQRSEWQNIQQQRGKK